MQGFTQYPTHYPVPAPSAVGMVDVSAVADQTCTRWDVTYVLTYDQTAGYRILDNSRHASSAC
jgi:hypothetical protein